MNRNITMNGDDTPNPPISNEELSQSIESLNKLINQGIINESSLPSKIFLLKAAYELGYYYYLTSPTANHSKNHLSKMKYYFNFCIAYLDEFRSNMNLTTNNNNNNNILKTIYFDKEDLEKLLKICEFPNNDWLTIFNAPDSDLDLENNMLIDKDENNSTEILKLHTKLNLEKESNIVENDFASLFNKISINPQDKIIIDVNYQPM
jgi:hypothetical protein